MRAIMMSIRKEHNSNIFAKKKKFEGRKTLPGNIEIRNYLDNTYDYSTASESDVKVIVYEPKTGGGCGMVVGEFICDYAQSFNAQTADFKKIADALCVSQEFAGKYFNKPKGFMLRVCEPKKYDTPKELYEFTSAKKADICKKCGKYAVSNECEYMSYACKNIPIITRPPQSWQYIQELED